MPDIPFTVGQTVKLKSCSQLMTIRAIEAAAGALYITCMWIDPQGACHGQVFMPSMLEAPK